jgi:hypothetical protein
MLGKVAVERLVVQKKTNKQLSQESKELKCNFALAQSANLDLEKKVAELAEALKVVRMRRKLLGQHLSSQRRSWKSCKRLMKTI